MASRVFPVLLSGGSGSRLWPLSRESLPKQLLPLLEARTPLQVAAKRATDSQRFEPLIVVANAEHRFLVAEQLRELGDAKPTILLEPVGRNTAPAIAAAAFVALQRDPDAVLLVMPADHHLPDAAAFAAAVDSGLEAARGGAFVLFGVTPDRAATGYGYIRAGGGRIGSARTVEAFVEKPDLPTAQRMIGSGEYLWNSGIFLLPAARLVAELEGFEPAVVQAARRSLEAARRDLDFLRLDAEAFAASPSISIDHALMERTTLAAVVPARFEWADMGAWSSLWEIEPHDPAGNVLHGDVVARQTSRSYVRSEGPLVATLGVDDLVVVATKDAVLVTARSADQQVRALVEALRRQGHPAADGARRTYRPWGWYELVDAGERFQVKRIMVAPGASLSLQRHERRAEHWVVVNGEALVQVDGAEQTLAENQSIDIPVGAAHRLSNPGEAPLHLIEVQTGAYLGEDDIVRLDDAYART